MAARTHTTINTLQNADTSIYTPQNSVPSHSNSILYVPYPVQASYLPNPYTVHAGPATAAGGLHSHVTHYPFPPVGVPNTPISTYSFHPAYSANPYGAQHMTLPPCPIPMTIVGPWSPLPEIHHRFIELAYGPGVLEGLLKGPNKTLLSAILDLKPTHWAEIESVCLESDKGQFPAARHSAREWQFHWTFVIKWTFIRLVWLAEGAEGNGEIVKDAQALATEVWALPFPSSPSAAKGSIEPGRAQVAGQILSTLLATKTANHVSFPIDLTSYWIWQVMKQVRETWNSKARKARKGNGEVGSITKAVEGMALGKLDKQDAQEMLAVLKDEIREEFQGSITKAVEGMALRKMDKQGAQEMLGVLKEEMREEFEEKLARAQNERCERVARLSDKIEKLEQDMQDNVEKLKGHVKEEVNGVRAELLTVVDEKVDQVRATMAQNHPELQSVIANTGMTTVKSILEYLGSGKANVQAMQKEQGRHGAQYPSPPQTPLLRPAVQENQESSD